ncbi:hypothetical protein Hanom_Chr13g01192551 [Helianthus anomalus]
MCFEITTRALRTKPLTRIKRRYRKKTLKDNRKKINKKMGKLHFSSFMFI